MTRFDGLLTFDENHPLIFTQLDFWIFFLLVLAVFSYIHKYKLTRSIFLFLTSLFFYFKTSGLLVLLLFSSIVINYFIGKGVWSTNSTIKKKGYVTLSILFNVLTLGYFKYAYFFTESFNEMFHTKFEVFNVFAQMGNGIFGQGSFVDIIVLPVGVSFFTFQSMAYLADTYWDKAVQPASLLDYLLFIAFFPQYGAGPICASHELLPQLAAKAPKQIPELSRAVALISTGLLKKMVFASYLATPTKKRAENQRAVEKGAILMFSLEMSREQLVMRILTAESKVDSQKLRSGNLGDEDWNKLSMATDTLATAPLYINDTSNLTPYELSSISKPWVPTTRSSRLRLT